MAYTPLCRNLEIIMSTANLYNINVLSQDVLLPPQQLKAELPLTEAAAATVATSRQVIEKILDRQDHRLLVVVGPCSIHDVDAAKEYAKKLKALSDQVADSIYIVMRVYFEKPRTTVGWKGLINDPDLDDSFRIEAGLRKARELLIWINDLGLPTATEALDPITPQYLSELMAWSAIGARTTESQTHREMASGLSMPVGFKNGTDGSLQVAINALHSVSTPHRFLGIDDQGQVAVITTRGNAYGHVVLRGGKTPNYDAQSISKCEQELQAADLPQNLVVDCSHANSSKKFERQVQVAEDVAQQILAGNRSIIGLMLESHLNEGNQGLSADLSQLKYGVSITDACIGWETTATLLAQLAEQLHGVLRTR